jgi:hypothetical protein
VSFWELEVGVEPTTCGLRNRGDPPMLMIVWFIRHFLGGSGIQREIWIPFRIPPTIIQRGNTNFKVDEQEGELVNAPKKQNLLKPRDDLLQQSFQFPDTGWLVLLPGLP